MEEHVICMMTAVCGLRDYADKAPGGKLGISGRALLMAANILEVASAAIGFDLSKLEESSGEPNEEV